MPPKSAGELTTGVPVSATRFQAPWLACFEAFAEQRVLVLRVMRFVDRDESPFRPIRAFEEKNVAARAVAMRDRQPRPARSRLAVAPRERLDPVMILESFSKGVRELRVRDDD